MRIKRPTWYGMFWFVVLAAVPCTAHATPPPSCSVVRRSQAALPSDLTRSLGERILAASSW